MIELIFECMKCKDKESFVNPHKGLEQPFCDKCCRPMFLVKTNIKENYAHD